MRDSDSTGGLIAERIGDAHRRAYILASRLDDEGLREQVEQVLDAFASIGTATDASKGCERWETAINKLTPALQALGAVARA